MTLPFPERTRTATLSFTDRSGYTDPLGEPIASHTLDNYRCGRVYRGNLAATISNIEWKYHYCFGRLTCSAMSAITLRMETQHH
ncbi:hypothetical protein J6590_059630 [Homalodisca vitripennis]|nr:hypothetical protein J6590_059630 [Homalodisca vitripennis]